MSERQHRWSGWPGAICLDCGAEDKREWCVVIHDWDPETGAICTRPECQNDPCPGPDGEPLAPNPPPRL